RHTRSKRDWSSDVCSSDLVQIVEFVGGDLRFSRRYVSIRMRAKQNLAQPFASKEAGLRALEFHFLEFLAAFPFKLRFGKRGFTRQLLHKVKQRFRKFRQAAKRNSTRVRPSVCG